MPPNVLQIVPGTDGSRADADSEKVAVAVAGCGYWGAKHVRVLSTLPNVGRIVAVDLDPRARKAIASAFPNVAVTADLSLALDEVSAVVIATPPHDHVATANAALRAGKHVLVEKPLTTSRRTAALLVECAGYHNLVLMVGHTFEFNPAVHELRRRMDAGELGDIQYIHSSRLNLGLYRSDVNVVWDLAPHDVSIMNFLLRSRPAMVRGWGSSNADRSTTDLAYFQLEYRDRNVVGYGHISWLDPRKVRQVTVVGNRRMAVYDDLAEERLRIFDRGVEPALDVSVQSIHERPMSYRNGDIVSPYINFQEPLMLQDRHFIECVLHQARPLSGGADAVAVVEAVEAIDRSIASGLSVSLASGTSEATPIPALA